MISTNSEVPVQTVPSKRALFFLALLSERHKMSYCGHYPCVVCPSAPLFTLLNDFSSETPGPNFFKLYVEPCVKGGLKICKNGHGL